MLKGLVTSLLVGTALVYGGFCAALYLFQDRLIFLRQELRPDALALVRRLHPQVEEVRVPTADGLTLHGWVKRGAVGGRTPLLIYFGGNAEEMSLALDDFATQPKLAVALVNYRGYGLSDGVPSETALTADSTAIYDALVARPDVDGQRVVVMGRSLGSGVAVYLATRRFVRGVVLVSPYDTLAGVAQSHYPVFPVAALMRHRFDSLSRAATIDASLLALAGSMDTLVTPDRSRALVRAWKGPHQLVELDGAGHNDITLHPDYWPAVNGFLDQMLLPK